MKSLAKQMAHYHRYHQRKSTQIAHFIGIPLMMFALFIPLSWFHIGVNTGPNLNIAWLAVIALSVYYLFLDILLALTMALIMIILGLSASVISLYTPNLKGLYIFLGCFAVSWILQFTGLKMEGKRPHFLDHGQQILIAPLYLIATILFKLGRYRDLKQKMLSCIAQENEA